MVGARQQRCSSMILASLAKILLLCLVFCKQINAKIEDEVGFENWMLQHEKSYEDAAEMRFRKEIYQQNVEKVKVHNMGGHGYELEVNRFADLTSNEFQKLYLGAPQNCSATWNSGNEVLHWLPSQLPDHVDWRTKGVVGPVKNQGQCGSCWTFSTTGAMETHMAIKYSHMFNLSEQQLVDCAQNFNNHGCKGGLPSQGFEYIHYAPGLETETTYPYKAKDGDCKFMKNKAVAFVKDVVNITMHDEDQMKQAVAMIGPVSIAYDVSSDFRLYKSGVYSSTECKTDPQHVNHAVLAVGYGTNSDGVPYWIVKNSWGPSWGMDGYFLIKRGENMCGLADCASYPIVSDHP